MMTFSAYSHYLGGAAEIFMCAAVLLFGFATIICWAHYGAESVRYFSEDKFKGRGFIFLYSAAVFCGAVVSGEAVWQVADLAIGAMTLINLFVLARAVNEVKLETDRFVSSKIRKKTRIR